MISISCTFSVTIADENVPGGIRYATWGLGIESLDWNVAAEKAALRVHEANPNMLIIVGGIFTGGFLSPAFVAPIRVPNQVISIHIEADLLHESNF